MDKIKYVTKKRNFENAPKEGELNTMIIYQYEPLDRKWTMIKKNVTDNVNNTLNGNIQTKEQIKLVKNISEKLETIKEKIKKETSEPKPTTRGKK